MPRIFAPHDEHEFNAGGVPFVNGAAVLPKDHASLPFFAVAKGYVVDESKHILTAIDTLPRATLNSIAVYMGITLDPTDGKYEVIRDIEGAISTLKRGTLTVTSSAGTENGDTNIDVVDEGDGQLVYKVTTDALTPLYKDWAGDWTKFTDNDDLTLVAGKKINVAEIDANGYIVGFGSATVVVNAGT